MNQVKDFVRMEIIVVGDNGKHITLRVAKDYSVVWQAIHDLIQKIDGKQIKKDSYLSSHPDDINFMIIDPGLQEARQFYNDAYKGITTPPESNTTKDK